MRLVVIITRINGQLNFKIGGIKIDSPSQTKIKINKSI